VLAAIPAQQKDLAQSPSRQEKKMKKTKGSSVVLDFANAKSGLAGTVRQAVALFLS
jgi:hypothetical protein